jgi:hypothetical protein
MKSHIPHRSAEREKERGLAGPIGGTNKERAASGGSPISDVDIGETTLKAQAVSTSKSDP